MENIKFSFLNPGEIKVSGYEKGLNDYVMSSQLLDERMWAVLVNQFRIHSDTDDDWRGEFWGKLMRGATFFYRLTGSNKLYKVLTNTVKDLLSTQEENGRISTYPIEKEFGGWDMWGRKYITMGLLSYCDICKSESLKKKVLSRVKKHMNYIIAHVGKGPGKIDILDTCNVFKGLNSSSILEPVMKLYNATENKKYLRFATYIVKRGFYKDQNLIDLVLKTDLNPYQFPVKKAYELMSNFEGLYEYYLATRKEEYLTAVKEVAERIMATDYTIIGCNGNNTEFLDNSTMTQTEKIIDADIAQETCCAVTYINLCLKLFRLTGEEKYLSCIEKSTYNTIYGAVNNENQTMKNSIGRVWTQVPPLHGKHGSFTFDSYSPLVEGRRGTVVGGFKLLQDGDTYGCCNCNGACGLAVGQLVSVMRNENDYFVNLFNNIKVSTDNLDLTMKADVFNGKSISIKLNSSKEIKLHIRVPDWMRNVRFYLDNEELYLEAKNGYVQIKGVFNNAKLLIKYYSPVVANVLNGKVAFTTGPIVLTRDIRLDNIEEPLKEKFKDGQIIKAHKINNDTFISNALYVINVAGETIKLVDYAQAGKNYDEDNSLISVWQKMC